MHIEACAKLGNKQLFFAQKSYILTKNGIIKKHYRTPSAHVYEEESTSLSETELQNMNKKQTTYAA